MENFEAIIKDMSVEEMEENVKILQKRIERKKSPWSFEDGDKVYYAGLDDYIYTLTYKDSEHSGLIDSLFFCKDEKIVTEKAELDYIIKKLWRLSEQQKKDNLTNNNDYVYYIFVEEGCYCWNHEYKYRIPLGTPIFYTEEVVSAIIEKLNNGESIPRFIDELFD